MPYCVMCRVSDGATGTRESLLTRHGVPVVFQTIAEAEGTAEDLQHERQHTAGAAKYPLLGGRLPVRRPRRWRDARIVSLKQAARTRKDDYLAHPEAVPAIESG